MLNLLWNYIVWNKSCLHLKSIIFKSKNPKVRKVREAELALGYLNGFNYWPFSVRDAVIYLILITVMNSTTLI